MVRQFIDNKNVTLLAASLFLLTITPTQKEYDIESPNTIPIRAAADPIAAVTKYAHQWNFSGGCARKEYSNS